LQPRVHERVDREQDDQRENRDARPGDGEDPAEDGTSYASFGLRPDRRHLLFVGGGSFQLTAQEVSTFVLSDIVPTGRAQTVT
jgi:hypothetical protein